MTYAIRVEGLGKRYTIGGQASTIREAVTRGLTAPIGLFSPAHRKKSTSREEIWALRDVSFDVDPGEMVGVIGRNGAGKSTLLRILSRITEPTEGRVMLRGLAGSLLEVGTGFHPELTGRENVYLNGAILGMRKVDIDRRFDAILAFAGVERFIDTPVKHFSSGMQVRLAFAVAAHLEPEILIVDEVLAVGDAEFQKKCIARMENVRASGRTVLFVSHNMPTVLRLCPRVILLDGGKVIADGRAQDVVEAYLATSEQTTAVREWSDPDEAPGDDRIRLKAVRVRSKDRHGQEVDIREPVEIEVEYRQLSEDPELRPGVTLRFANDEGVVLFIASEFTYRTIWQRPRRPGIVRSICTIPGNFLAEGRVFVRVVVSSIEPAEAHVNEDDVVAFIVVDPGTGDGVRGQIANDWPGVVRPMLEWTVTDDPAILAEPTPGT
jgi:lipopolysaccharide transport system ATP-binding protein